MVYQQSQTAYGHDEELHPERVVVTIVRRFEFRVDEETRGDGARDERHLHRRVVNGDKRREQVEVPREEHHREHDLRFPGDTCT